MNVDYTLLALCRVAKFDFTSLILWEKNGVEQIVWPRPPHGDHVTLIHLSISKYCCLDEH